jgi:lysophospholipase L1-like esterase
MRCLLIPVFAVSLMAQPMNFYFGPAAAPEGSIKVAADQLYSAERGYGYERDPSQAPVYFSVRVPREGNYRVIATLGSPEADATTTIKAELRRLMIEKVHTAAGQFERRTFLVNVRRPQITGDGEVRLKDREKTSEAWAWDDKITFEFTNSHPAVWELEISKADDVPTVFIAGDSTSTDQPLEPYNSWGQMITAFFKPEIAVANNGESGESLRSFLGERRWAKVMSQLRAGDFVLIQMGHNDQKEKGEGVGAFTTYKADLKRFVADTRSVGATPILVTSMNRLTFDADGKITNSLGDYPEAVRQAAKEENAPLIDLNAMSKPFYEALGTVEAHKAFAGNDTTHHSDYGSYELAKCVVNGIRAAVPELAKYLVAMPPFDPAHPDAIASFDIPAEPMGPPVKPYGQ